MTNDLVVKKVETEDTNHSFISRHIPHLSPFLAAALAVEFSLYDVIGKKASVTNLIDCRWSYYELINGGFFLVPEIENKNERECFLLGIKGTLQVLEELYSFLDKTQNKSYCYQATLQIIDILHNKIEALKQYIADEGLDNQLVMF